MRFRLMATYLGVPYHAGLGPDGTEVTLFSPGPPPDELGFTAAAGHWRKQVSVTDLEALWQSRLVGEYGGEPCLVLDDPAGRLHLAYLGRDAVRARQLGYWEIDREVFEVVVPTEDVAGLTEERVEFPLSAAMFPSSNPAPPRDGAPRSGADPWSAVLPSAGVSGPVGTEPEPDTLIHTRLGPRGYPPPGTDSLPAAPTGPRTRMEPTGRGQPPAQPPRAQATRPQPPIPPLRVQPAPPAPPAPAPPASAAPPFSAAPPPEPGGYAQTDRSPGPSDQMAAWHGSPAPGPWTEPWPARESGGESWPETWDASETRADGLPIADEPFSAEVPQPDGGPEGDSGPRAEPAAAPPSTRRTARRERVSPQAVFAELLNLAGIPDAAYAAGQEVPGAMCVVKADGGFEVFSATEDARLEVHFFEEEEAAYFYLFGVLAAEAVRSGGLRSTRANGHVNGSGETAAATAAAAARENVSKYLRSRKLPTSPSRPDIVN
jgi:hypothetical protein